MEASKMLGKTDVETNDAPASSSDKAEKQDKDVQTIVLNGVTIALAPTDSDAKTSEPSAKPVSSDDKEQRIVVNGVTVTPGGKDSKTSTKSAIKFFDSEDALLKSGLKATQNGKEDAEAASPSPKPTSNTTGHSTDSFKESVKSRLDVDFLPLLSPQSI